MKTWHDRKNITYYIESDIYSASGGRQRMSQLCTLNDLSPKDLFVANQMQRGCAEGTGETFDTKCNLKAIKQSAKQI